MGCWHWSQRFNRELTRVSWLFPGSRCNLEEKMALSSKKWPDPGFGGFFCKKCKAPHVFMIQPFSWPLLCSRVQHERTNFCLVFISVLVKSMSVANSSYYSCTCKNSLFVVYRLVAFQINDILKKSPEIFWDAYQFISSFSSQEESELLLFNYTL